MDEVFYNIQKALMGKTQTVEEVRYPTGSDLLDVVVGGDKNKFGYLGGMMVNIVGDKSSGKSFLCYELIAASYYKYKDKLKWVYDNCESSSIMDTTSLYGFNVLQGTENMPQSKTVEDMACNVRHFINTLSDDELGIYVVDSLDGLSSEELEDIVEERQKAFEKNKPFDKGSFQMGSAKFLSQEFFRTLSRDISKKQCLLIIVSQLRENVGGGLYAAKYKRAGGKAMDFYAHTILWLTTRETMELKDRTYGVVIEAETKKSKTPRPYRKCLIPIVFAYGIDNTAANIDFLYNLKTKTGRDVKKTDQTLDWNGMQYSRQDLIKFIEDNKLQHELRDKVRAEWEATEDAIKNATVRGSKYAL